MHECVFSETADEVSARVARTRTSGLLTQDYERLRCTAAVIRSAAEARADAGDEAEAEAMRRHVSVLEAVAPSAESECEMIVTGMTPDELNAVRRTLLADVRYLAVDVVSISANSSQMFDEMLASRVAHVPLRAPRSSLQYDSYRVELSLEARHAGADGVVSVMSDDLRVSDADVTVQRGMRLLRLQPGQSVSLTAIARPGTAREHTKWRAAHTAVVLLPEHASFDEGEVEAGASALVLKVGTNGQTAALQSIEDAICELQLRIQFAREDVLNPTGGSDVDLVDPFDVVGVGYA